MTDSEYNSFLEYLKKEVVRGNPSDLEQIKKKRSKVLYYASRCGFDKGDKINWAKFNGWMLKYSVYKKPLSVYSTYQLDELISQFQSMYKKQTDEKSI
ncbi:hypothetical protein [Flammeovirga aprica]|nr:hypothetical protein [Flammeovirga aprica]